MIPDFEAGDKREATVLKWISDLKFEISDCLERAGEAVII